MWLALELPWEKALSSMGYLPELSTQSEVATRGGWMTLCECGCGEEVKPGKRFVLNHDKRKPTPRRRLCECGCGGYASPGKRFITGHNRCKTPWRRPPVLQTLCQCGCGDYAAPGNTFIHGHYMRLHPPMRSSDAVRKSIETRAKNMLQGIPPLPDGWKVDKDSKMATNKKCGVYLGVFIAEQLLSNVFNGVQKMPLCNPGFDFICNNNKRIDVKSSATGDKNGYWIFGIKKNKVADYFLCIAFDNRDDLNPQHVWMIPGDVINHLAATKISKSTADKWSRYEISLCEIVASCNDMKTNDGERP